ncbi:hypothetical protein M9458_052058 [Cirrhinus mrigala]|uniref:Vegetative cell wall protein gp1-like n=1 Tax=Cirrhinus mrigala TaxID=683832 RepID=A0ABD0MRX5_CIRMR
MKRQTTEFRTTKGTSKACRKIQAGKPADEGMSKASLASLSDLKPAAEVSSGLQPAPELPSDLKPAAELSSGLQPDPELPSDHRPASEVPSGLKSAPEAFPIGEAAPMPPEVSASAVEPLMEEALTAKLSASPFFLSASSVTVLPRSPSKTQPPVPPRRAAPPPVPPRRAAPPPVPPRRAAVPPALPPVPPRRAAVPPAPPPVPPRRAAAPSPPTLSASSVPAFPRSLTVTQIPVSPWRAAPPPALPPVPPWRIAPPPVPPRRARASPVPPPAPPWRAPVPPALPPAPPWRAPAPPAPPRRAAPPTAAPPAQPPAPPWRALASPAPPPALPQRVPVPPPPAPPWRAPVPPAPPWWVPALPVLPQSPGPPQGPGPPALALSRSRPTAPLDCYSVGASGSRSLGGGAMSRIWSMSLSPHLHTLTVTLHLGLHLPSSTALIASAPVTNQAFYKNPGPPQCTSRFLVPGSRFCSPACRLPLGLLLSFIGLFSPTACDIPVCSRLDPACTTMSLSSSFNKSLHMDPLASRLSLLVTITEMTPHLNKQSGSDRTGRI